MATHTTPPPAGKITRRKPGPASQYVAAMNKIIEKPWEQWRELSRFESPRGATDVLQRIRDGRRPIPRGSWEFKVEVLEPGDKRGGSRLLARFMGRKPDRIARWRYGVLVPGHSVIAENGETQVGRL